MEELRKGQGGGVARLQADRVGVRRDDVVGADVHGVHDAAPLGGGAVLGRAGGGEALGLLVAANHERRPRWAARNMTLGVSSRRG